MHVVYGLPTLKTHAKCILIIRREGDGVRHYVHVGTGNYHPANARLYTDFGLLTCDDKLGADVADMFNQLTGFARPGAFRRVLVAPAHMRDGILEEIDRTIEAKASGQDVRIAMKMNSLVDKRCIQALYRASQAGVPVDLNIRGICCLRPGMPGVSEHIRVHSIVGRFLEHSRIYSFERGDEHLIYIGSADLMPRNLDTRVELLAPSARVRCRASCSTRSSAAWPTTRTPGCWPRTAPGPAARRAATSRATRSPSSWPGTPRARPRSPPAAADPRYQCTPRMRCASAVASPEARSWDCLSPFAAEDSGNTL